jgi:hypothetical protein
VDRHYDRRSLDRERVWHSRRYRSGVCGAVAIACQRIAHDPIAVAIPIAFRFPQSLAIREPVALTQPDDPGPDLLLHALHSV